LDRDREIKFAVQSPLSTRSDRCAVHDIQQLFFFRVLPYYHHDLALPLLQYSAPEKPPARITPKITAFGQGRAWKNPRLPK
jgi:hypothetical protein